MELIYDFKIQLYCDFFFFFSLSPLTNHTRRATSNVTERRISINILRNFKIFVRFRFEQLIIESGYRELLLKIIKTNALWNVFLQIKLGNSTYAYVFLP